MASEKRSLSIEARVTDLATNTFTKMLGSARAFAGGAIPLFKATAVAFGTISVAVTGAFIAFRKYSEGLDKIAKVSDKFGVTAESLTAIRDGAELAGIDIDKLATSMKSFELAVSKANDGSKEQRETFQALGLASEQFAGDQLNIVDVLAKVAGGLEGVSSASERTRILVALFGKTGADLAPLLKEGSDGIQRMAAEAKAAGAVFTREELARVEAFNDSWTKLQQTFRALAERLVVDLSPAITELFETLNTVFRENSGEIRGAFLDLLSVLIDGFQVMKTVFDTVFLSIQGWKGLVLAVQAFGSQMTGTVEDQKKANQAMYEQGRYLAELSEGWGSTSQSVDAMRAALERLRKTPPPEPAVKPPKPVGAGEVEAVPATFFDSFNAGLEKARQQWTDFTRFAQESGQRLVGGTLDGLADALTAGALRTKHWSDAFKDFGRQALTTLTQIITKLAVMQAFDLVTGGSGANFLGGRANGGVDRGVVTGTYPLRAFASGGIVREPTLALMGEGRAPAEAFVPLPDGKSIPVSFRGGGDGGGSRDVTVNLHFHSADPRGAADLLRQNEGTIKQIIQDALNSDTPFRNQLRGAVA